MYKEKVQNKNSGFITLRPGETIYKEKAQNKNGGFITLKPGEIIHKEKAQNGQSKKDEVIVLKPGIIIRFG